MATERLQVILEMITGSYKAQAVQAATATQTLGASARTTTAQTATMGSTLKGAGAGGMLAIAGGAIAAKQAFDGTVGAFASFDDKMNESLAIMGNVSEAMRQDMSDAAREVAKVTRFSADDAAESYFFLASAGLDAAASIEAMPAVAAFAQAGMFDMATATDLATDAQSALGLASDDAAVNLENLTRVTDVFVASNTLANTSVQQVAEAMTNRAGAALRALNKDVEEGTAVLAALADQGVKGAQAGQQLGIVLRDLQTRALENADAFKDAGISVFDAAGNMRNIADVLGDVETRMDGMSDAQKRAELSALGFSDRSIAVLTTLLGTSDAIREYEKDLRSAGGTTAEVAENQLKSATAQWELFKSELGDVGLEVGENVLPALMDMLPALKGAAENAGDVVVQFSEIVALSSPVLSFFSELNALLEGQPAFALPELSLGGFNPAELFGDFLKGPIGLGLKAKDELDEFLRLIDNSPTRIRGFSTGLENHNEVVTLATTGYGQMGDNVGSADEAMLNMARRTGPQAIQVVEELAGEFESATPNAQDLANAIAAVNDALRAAADPAFAAVDAVLRYNGALADLAEAQEDPESSARDLAEAELDVASAALDAQAALSELGAGNIEGAISAIADALGVSHGHAQDLLETVGILNGQEVEMIFSISMPAADRALLNAAQRGGSGGDPVAQRATGRQHGGPVREGRPYIVGETGPEMVIPSSNGQVISNADMRALIGGSRGGDFTVTFERSDPHTDAQLVGHLRSVQRLMETA